MVWLACNLLSEFQNSCVVTSAVQPLHRVFPSLPTSHMFITYAANSPTNKVSLLRAGLVPIRSARLAVFGLTATSPIVRAMIRWRSPTGGLSGTVWQRFNRCLTPERDCVVPELMLAHLYGQFTHSDVPLLSTVVAVSGFTLVLAFALAFSFCSHCLPCPCRRANRVCCPRCPFLPPFLPPYSSAPVPRCHVPDPFGRLCLLLCGRVHFPSDGTHVCV